MMPKLDLTKLELRLAQLQAAQNGPASPPVEGGGSGPHDPGMEIRVAALEIGVQDVKAGIARIETLLTAVATKADVAKVDDRVRKIETDTLPKLGAEVAELKGRVSQLPTTTAIFACMGSLVTLVLAIGGVAFVVIRAAASH